MSIRILLAEDHPVLRSALRSILDSEPDFEVIGEAETGRDTVRLVGELQPDLVVMDVRMPDINGIEASRQSLAINAGLKIVGLSASDDPVVRNQMLGAGVISYIRKEMAFEELPEAIRKAMNPGNACGPTVSEK